MQAAKGRKLNFRRAAIVLASAWIVLVALPSMREVRALLVAPLYVHDDDASGEFAYVMADGYAYLERLRAASDLFHLQRVPAIYLLEEPQSAGYDFVNQRQESASEKAIRYLGLYGVPREAIHTVTGTENAAMGSLSEAEAVLRALPANTRQVVVVTSAPHTRRSCMCFRRTLPADIQVKTYSASAPSKSAELFAPIWQEYGKLIVYFFLA